MVSLGLARGRTCGKRLQDVFGKAEEEDARRMQFRSPKNETLLIFFYADTQYGWSGTRRIEENHSDLFSSAQQIKTDIADKTGNDSD